MDTPVVCEAYPGIQGKGDSVGQPEGSDGEPLEFPVARLPGDERPDEPQHPRRSEAHREPSWTLYARPMRGAEDTTDPDLHPRYWEAQLEAARRGSLAWGFAAFFLGYGGFYLVGLIVSGALPPRSAGFDPSRPPDLGPLLLLSFAPNILLGLVPALYSWRKGNGLRSDFGIVPTLRDVKVGLSCGAVALLTSWLLGLVLISLSGPPPESRVNELVHGQKSIWLFLFALFAFLGAPLTEELLMRGALWGALEYHRVPRIAILLLTALIFAFIHEEMWRLPILFVGGVAIGTARMITGRVGASMIAHATNNFLPALVLFFAAN
jgi:uncharacterized protein